MAEHPLYRLFRGIIALVLAFALVPIVGVAAASANAAESDKNHVSFWQNAGYGACEKLEDKSVTSQTSYLVPAPPAGALWTIIVVNAGSSASNANGSANLEYPAPQPGQSLDAPRGKPNKDGEPGDLKKISHVIRCYKPTIPSPELPDPGLEVTRNCDVFVVTVVPATDDEREFTKEVSTDGGTSWTTFDPGFTYVGDVEVRVAWHDGVTPSVLAAAATNCGTTQTPKPQGTLDFACVDGGVRVSLGDQSDKAPWRIVVNGDAASSQSLPGTVQPGDTVQLQYEDNNGRWQNIGDVELIAEDRCESGQTPLEANPAYTHVQDCNQVTITFTNDVELNGDEVANAAVFVVTQGDAVVETISVSAGQSVVRTYTSAVSINGDEAPRPGTDCPTPPITPPGNPQVQALTVSFTQQCVTTGGIDITAEVTNPNGTPATVTFHGQSVTVPASGKESVKAHVASKARVEVLVDGAAVDAVTAIEDLCAVGVGGVKITATPTPITATTTAVAVKGVKLAETGAGFPVNQALLVAGLLLGSGVLMLAAPKFAERGRRH